jgi:phage terminase large subunit-like protein|tara:strand:- start:710 stop:1054 length:345 start_codon:yes stop_codon:yes gene_type:complete
MKLPAKHIKIGYTKYKLQVWDKLTASSNEAYGEFFQREQAIGIDGNQSGTQLVNTLLHEIMHGIVYQYGMKMDGDADVREETMVNVITNGLCQVYVDNPWLLPWIQREIKSDSE